MTGVITAEGAIDPALIDHLRAEMDIDRVPGLSVGVLHEGRWATAGLGVTNVHHPLAVDGDTLFQIGSVTKTFTATALLQLADEGAVELHVPIRRYLPEFRVADETTSAEVTIAQCLTHSCGFDGEFFENTGMGDDALARVVARMEILEDATPLGRLWGYNNAAFYPLGRILEVIDDDTFENAITRRILRPLGMSGAGFFAQDVVYGRVAVGHTVVDDSIVIARPWAMPRSSNPVGGLIASAEHLMTYARFQIEGEPTILSDALRTASHRPAGPVGDEPAIGLGWWLEERGGVRIVSHGGGANGQPCHFAMVPERGFAMAVLTNGSAGGTTARRAIDRALTSYLDLPVPPAPDASIDSALLADGAGVYETHLDRWRIRIDDDAPCMEYTVLGEWLDDPYPATSFEPFRVPVTPVSPDRFLVAPGTRNESPARFLRDEHGDAAWLRYRLRTAPRRPLPDPNTAVPEPRIGPVK
ncbi:serine hydrolase domain-containing protein [Streptosporangium sp. NPDC006013]|uniref:serine hydrolase domain-containing protein n=1 Tax=Streptosporangium sp. NPDC006013 TaxID=3155596 RepID=UPI0033BCC329